MDGRTAVSEIIVTYKEVRFITEEPIGTHVYVLLEANPPVPGVGGWRHKMFAPDVIVADIMRDHMWNGGDSEPIQWERLAPPMPPPEEDAFWMRMFALHMRKLKVDSVAISQDILAQEIADPRILLVLHDQQIVVHHVTEAEAANREALFHSNPQGRA